MVDTVLKETQPRHRSTLFERSFDGNCVVCCVRSIISSGVASCCFVSRPGQRLFVARVFIYVDTDFWGLYDDHRDVSDLYTLLLDTIRMPFSLNC